MPIMTEAMSLEDFERMRKGLPPIKVKQIKRPEPEKPEIENEIKFEDIKEFIALDSVKRSCLRNKEGIMFLGYDVTIRVMSTASRGPGRPPKDAPEPIKEEQTLIGWMNEGEFLTLVRHFRNKINTQVINW